MNATQLRNSGPVILENGSMQSNIEAYCKLLSLSSVLEHYESSALDAAKSKISYQENISIVFFSARSSIG